MQVKGFAFVEFLTKEAAAEAVEKLDRFLVDGREVTVMFAKDGRKEPGRDGRYRVTA